MIPLRRLAVLLLAMLSLTVPVSALGHLPGDARAAFSGIEVNLDRPSFAGTDQTVECTLTVRGGPAGDLGGNYSYSAEVVGTNTTGSSVVPNTATSQSGVWKLNVTMPSEGLQKIKIRINATSTASSGSSSDTFQADFTVTVVVPILIKATVFNTGAVDARNVTTRFYADGVLISTQSINVSAGGSQVVSYNWTFLKIKTGKHVVSVSVDEPNDLVEFSDGNNVVSRTIFVGKQSNAVGAIITGAVIIVSAMVFLMWIQKPARRGKK